MAMATATATLELPVHFRHISCFSSSGAAAALQPKLEGKECSLWRMRFAASSGWRSALMLNSKEASSRAPCCMSVDVESESAEAESQPAESRRAEEKFAVLNTGKWECRSCGYTYDQSTGEPSYPIAAGTEFRQLPDDWVCPTCGAARSYFNSKSVEVAGFAENQKFGLGTNSLTSGQKSILIYGSLLLFFLLFLSGYFLQ